MSSLLKIGRTVMFAISISLALGWLIAPDLVARGRDRVASLAHLSRAQGVGFTSLAFGPRERRWPATSSRADAEVIAAE